MTKGGCGQGGWCHPLAYMHKHVPPSSKGTICRIVQITSCSPPQNRDTLGKSPHVACPHQRDSPPWFEETLRRVPCPRPAS